jgi:hypothetical protein
MGVARRSPLEQVRSAQGTSPTLLLAAVVSATPSTKDWVSALNVTLTPGTWWFSVVPQATTTFGRSFNSNSFGLNQIGTQTNDLQYFNSAFFGETFNNADHWGVFQTFSSGVYDDPLAGDSAPEPSSLILLGSGVAGLSGLLRRQLVG